MSLHERRPQRVYVGLFAACVVLASIVSGGVANAAKAGGDLGSASAFVQHVFELRAAGKSGASFDLLFPPQRAMADRSKFVATCTAPPDLRVSKLHVTQVVPKTVRVPGTNLSAKAIAVTVTYTAVIGTSPPIATTVVVPAIKTRHGWTWVMSQRMFDVCAATSKA
jgi:hypothetical protein